MIWYYSDTEDDFEPALFLQKDSVTEPPEFVTWFLTLYISLNSLFQISAVRG